MATRDKGKEEYITIAEAIRRWWGDEKKAAQVPAVLKSFNPLQLRVADSVKIETPRLLKFTEFVVAMVDVYERHVGGKALSFVDYVLVDDTTETNQKWVTLRVNSIDTAIPDAQARMCYLALMPHKECEWDAEVEHVWNSVLPHGELQVQFADGDAPAVYRRVDELTEPYLARVTEFKSDEADETSEEIVYWDFAREVRPGKTEYYFFERNERTGRVQTFVGEPVDEGDIKLRRREVK